MVDQRESRLSLVRSQLAESRVDGILISNLANVRYLTGFSGSNALLMVTPWDAALLTDSRYRTQAAEEVGKLASITTDNDSLWESLWKHLSRSAGVKVVGFESTCVVHRDFERLQESGARWQWRPLENQVEALRQRKDRGEIELISQAATLATEALGRLIGAVKPGMTEAAVAGILEKALRDGGSEGFPFPTIVASGARAALPHARTSTKEIASGEFLLVDFGAIIGGYCSDMTRTFVVGTAGIRERDVYKIVRAANEKAVTGIRVGMKGKEVDALARGHIENAGYGAAFGHGLGHGIGLEVHEAPRLGRTVEAILPSETVVTVEPGIYIQGWGGVRIEDDVYLSTDGARVLTPFTRDLIELK